MSLLKSWVSILLLVPAFLCGQVDPNNPDLGKATPTIDNTDIITVDKEDDEALVIDAYIFTGEIPTLKNKTMLKGESNRVYDVEQDVKFTLRSTISKDDISLITSVSKPDGGNDVYVFVPYLVQEEDLQGHKIYEYFYGLGKFQEGDSVSIAVVKKSNNNMIVYRSSFYVPVRKWFTFESGMVHFQDTGDLRIIVGAKIFPVPRDLSLDLNYRSFSSIAQHISIYLGATVSGSVFSSTEVEDKQAVLTGLNWEINRYASLTGGMVLFIDRSLENQYYLGFTLNNDLFGELIKNIVK